jgi:hypothetical protein
MHGRGEKVVQGFGGKARNKETTRKTKARCDNGIRMDLRETGLGVLIDFDWLRIGTSGGLL